jgi:hypothetical protein
MTPEQAESLAIKRMIFHEVGGKQETLLDAVVEAPDHALFFLERVKSVLRGSRYIFNADSTVPPALRRAAKSEAGFVAESRKLASAFHQSHKEAPNSKPGTFFMFALTSSAGLVHALLKFDRPESVAYTISVARDGKKTAKFTANPLSINESKTGLQKAALLTETDGTFEALVTDRAGRYAVSQYFERFLGAHRYAEPAELTAALFDLAKKAAARNAGDLTPEVARTVNKQIFEAIGRLQGYDPEESEKFVNAAFGPTSDDANIRKDFQKLLESRAVAGESFKFDRRAIAPPSLITIKTTEGVQVTYDQGAAGFVERHLDGERGGYITIHTQHTLARDDVA